MAQVLIRYWAAARTAAGRAEEQVRGGALGEALDAAAAAHGPELARVLARSSFLVDGVRARRSDPLTEGAVVEVLPPFAGGSGPAPVAPTAAPPGREPAAARGTLLVAVVLALGLVVAAALGGDGGRAVLLLAVVSAQALVLSSWWAVLAAPGAVGGAVVAGVAALAVDALLLVGAGTPSLAPVTWVLGPVMTAAIVSQLLRRDGRTDLVRSLVATLSGTVVVVCGALLLDLSRLGHASGSIAATAVGTLLGTVAALLLPAVPGGRPLTASAATAAAAAGAGGGLLCGLATSLGAGAGAVLGAVTGVGALLAVALVAPPPPSAVAFRLRRAQLLAAAALPLLVAGPLAWAVARAWTRLRNGG